MKKITILLILILYSTLVYSVSTDGCRFYYSMDDADISGDAITDLCGNYNGELTNTPHTGGDGIVNEAVAFWLSGQEYINTTSPLINTTNLTITFWVFNTRNESGVAGILGNGNTGDLQIDFYSDTLRIVRYGVAVDLSYTFDSADKNKWTFLAIVLNNSRYHVYQDGSWEHTDSATAWGNDAEYFVASIGEIATTLDGSFDEFSVWDRSLTNSEIDELYNSGAGHNPFSASDTTPPNIDDTSWNLTSDGDCPAWRINKSIPCVTIDYTPTITFDTDENADCAINWADRNYTNITNSDSTWECSTTGSTTHICTAPDYVTTAHIVNNSLYVGCQDSSGNENISSTSGALTIYYGNKGVIPEDVGVPFFINTSKTNNNNSIHFSLNAGETYEQNWTVTTNYSTASNWSFFSWANISTFYNYSSYTNISIIAAAGDTCTCPGYGTDHTFDLSDGCEVEYCMAGIIDFSGTGSPVRCYGEWSIYNISFNVGEWSINTDDNCKINTTA